MFYKLYKNESGQSMVLVALMLTVLLGFGALAIDIGYMTYQRSSLQNAADSAALAGAMLVPLVGVEDYDTTYENFVKNEMYNYANSNFDKIKVDEIDFINIETDESLKTVDIQITQLAPKFLGGILNNSPNYITVYAQAEYETEWNGESLPFVNYQETPNVGATIGIWGKVNSGNFETMDITGENQEIILDEENKTFLLKNIDDGIDIDNGNLGGGTLSGIGNLIKNEICGTLTTPRTIIYFLSVKDNGCVTSVVENNGKITYFYRGEEIDNHTVFAKSDLYLIEAEVTAPYNQQGYTDGNGNDDHIQITIIGRYDLNNPNDRPTNYRSSVAISKSKLIN